MNGAVLVTGATGFVGRNVVDALRARGDRVIGYSAPLPAGVVLPELADVTSITGDIGDMAHLLDVMRAHGVDRVIHLAAMTPSPADEIALAQRVLAVNIGGTAAVMRAAIDAGVKCITMAGSVAVYGGSYPDGMRFDENLPVAPQSLYAISKDGAEKVFARLGTRSGMDWRIGRLGRVFGRHEYETGMRATMSQIFVATEAARRGQAVSFARPCRKAWQYSPDSAAALLMLLDAKTAPSRLYHLGAPDVWSLEGWCSLLAEAFPAFRYQIGSDTVGAEIDLNGATDGGNLSFARFEREIGPMPTRAMQAAFTDYLGLAVEGVPA